ncbi:MAG: MFS transporter [Gammaproteobacteria bacterium]|nr:MFS transporter [Gammaproteobacteria bacterium]
MHAPQDRRQIISWSMYDWANSAYATTVMAGFFPIFFKQYWSAGADVTDSTFHLGVANSLASVLIAALAPLLGAVADRAGARKKFLLTFGLLGVVMTGSLYFVQRGDWAAATVLYVLASIGFLGGNIFYDALLVNVARPNQRDRVSSLGYSLGYLGGGLLFAVNVWMTLQPQTFGLADAGEAVRLSFVCVALWWALFALPLLIFVKEPCSDTTNLGLAAISQGLRQFMQTFREIRQLRMVWLFLVGYWLYIDGVDTIVVMAVDYGMSLGFDSNSLIVALLITQVVGFPAALVFGRLGERIGAKYSIYLAIAVYVGVTLWAYRISNVNEFYAIAATIGLVQGGIQALSRSMYSRLIPQDKSAEFFGFYNMLGKFATVLGPLLMGWVGVISGSPRVAILSLIVLFVAGAVVLWWVDESPAHNR